MPNSRDMGEPMLEIIGAVELTDQAIEAIARLLIELAELEDSDDA